MVKTYTLQEFWELPEPQDRSKMELIKGVLYMTPPPDDEHQDIASTLDSMIHNAIRDRSYTGSVYMPRTAIGSTTIPILNRT